MTIKCYSRDDNIEINLKISKNVVNHYLVIKHIVIGNVAGYLSYKIYKAKETIFYLIFHFVDIFLVNN